MPDLEDDGFTEEAFKKLSGEGDAPATPAAPVVDPPKDPTPPVPAPAADPKKEEDKPDADKDKPTGTQPDGTPKPGEEKPTPSDSDKPADPAEKPGDGTPPKPATPEEPVAPQPLTKSDVESVVSNLLNTERASGKELETTTKEVLDAYYPDGLSNVLVHQGTGKELRTPQDVIDVTNGEMTTEQAAQWLMNEQHKLDVDVANIKNQAKEVAETTLNFKRDSMTVLQKYEPLFKAYPHLQRKSFDLMMKQVKVDKERNVILSAPDVIDLYDTYLEPYQQAFEYSTNKPATAPTPNPNEPAKPTAEDRMDENGDGTGASEVDDPNDFAQQVKKELAKPL